MFVRGFLVVALICLVGVARAEGPVEPAKTQSQKLSAADGRAMLARFKSAQAAKLKSLEQTNKTDLKDLEASQKSRKKDWHAREKEARQKFLADHPKGPEVREYFRDYVRRLKNLDEMLAEEKKKLQGEQKVRVESLKRDQASRLKEFQAAVDRGESPDPSLWP